MNNTQYNKMNQYGCFLKPEDRESYTATTGRKKKKLFKPKKRTLPAVFTNYEPCVHLHFKPEIVDRDCLTKDQYYDMLATPKGYRWMGDADCQNPNLDINKKKKKKKDKKIVVIKEKPKTSQEAGDFANDFVEDMWDVMSPEITERLIDFLVNEFGMSAEEAEDFIECKSSVGRQAVCKKKKSKILVGIGPKYKWVKEFSDVFSKRIEQYIISMLLTQRTPRARRLAERILEYLCDLTGEKTTLQNPKTKIQKTMVLIADRLAIWIEGLLKDTEKTVKKTPSITPEEATDEEGERSDKEKPEDKEKPLKDTKSKDELKSKEKDKKEPGSKDKEKKDDKEEKDKGKPDAKGEEKPKEEGKEPEDKDKETKDNKKDDTETTEDKEKVEDKENAEDKEKAEGKETEDEKTAQDKEAEDKKTAQDKETTEEKDKPKDKDNEEGEDKKKPDVEEKEGEDKKVEESKDENKEITDEGEKKDDTEKSEDKNKEDEIKTEGDKETTVEEKTKSEDEEKTDKDDDKEKKDEPIEEISEDKDKTTSEAEKEETAKDSKDKISEKEKPGDEKDKAKDEDTTEKKIEQPKPLPLPAEEIKPKEVLDYLKDDITATTKGVKTDRQKAIKDVLEKRVEKIDKGQLPEEDIDDVTSRVAHWMDNIMKSTEQLKKEEPQLRRGSAFKIKMKTGSTLEVQKLSSNTVAQETAEIRGIEAPPREKKIPKSSSPMNVESKSDWVDWTGKVGEIMDKWGSFMTDTISDTEKYLDAKNKRGSKVIDWEEWKQKCRLESLKYRAESERLKKDAELWGNKIDNALKDMTEKQINSTDLSS